VTVNRTVALCHDQEPVTIHPTRVYTLEDVVQHLSGDEQVQEHAPQGVWEEFMPAVQEQEVD